MSFPFVLPFVRWASVSTLHARAPISRRRIYDHELVFILSGGGQIQLGENLHVATPGRLFLFQPCVRHSLFPDAELHLIAVHFDWERDDTSVEEENSREPREIPGWNLRGQPFLELHRHPEIQRALEAIVAEYSHYDDYSQSAAGALLAAFFPQLQRVLPIINERTLSTSIGADAIRRVQQARELLESQPENPLGVEEVAARVQWSGDHLRRMMRAVLGTSPLELQRTARLRLARELLSHKEFSIAEVGEHCGFDDASHFARVFKARTGLTPRQYARLARST